MNGWPLQAGWIRWWIAAVALWWGGVALGAAPLPSKPSEYVTDEAGLLDAATLRFLRERLAQFERDTSNQVVVALFRKLPEGEALEDFTQRTAEAWGVGQAGRNNGVVLFVFRDDRQIRIEVGYGLEGAIPDTVAARIIANEIRPRFRIGEFSGGVVAGAEALMAASIGEYTGSGRTVDEESGVPLSAEQVVVAFLVMLLLIALLTAVLRRVFRDTVYNHTGRRRVSPPVIVSMPDSSWGGGGWSGGGWSGGGSGGGWSRGGGGFSGGGGSFGGGGASGNW